MQGPYGTQSTNAPYGAREFGNFENVQISWAHHPMLNTYQLTSKEIDSTAVDAGNTDGTTAITTALRAGLVMGQVTTTKKWKQWNPAAVDGTEVPAGVLEVPYYLSGWGSAGSVLADRIMTSGYVKADQLIIPGETTRGISGKTYEFLLRDYWAGIFQLQENLPYKFAQNNLVKYVEATAGGGTYTVSAADHGKTILTVKPTGTAGALAVTLPDPAPASGQQWDGFRLNVVRGVTSTVTVGCAENGSFLVNGAAANSVVLDAAGDAVDLTAMRFNNGTIVQTIYVAKNLVQN